ncbi:GNAT family N-acetyltransferase [Halovulum sp. GXIMD14793]
MSDTTASTANFTIQPGLAPEHRRAAAKGYWAAFARKLRYPLGPASRAVTFIERVLDPTHAISAVSADGTFLGVAGFKTPEGAFIGSDFSDMTAVYGTLRAIWRGLLISALERKCDTHSLLMDGIFVQEKARGLGVGTALLHAVEQEAQARGLAEVRLDVIDTNPRARALYERQGPLAKDVQSTGFLKPLFGFAEATTMIKAVGAA